MFFYRISDSGIRTTTALLKDLFKRVVKLEQRNCQLEMENERMAAKMRREREEQLLRFCNGSFTWKIDNFYDRLKQNTLYSNGFYTSPFGYKVELTTFAMIFHIFLKICLRCNVSRSAQDGVEYFGLFIHIMQGENDDSLRWKVYN